MGRAVSNCQLNRKQMSLQEVVKKCWPEMPIDDIERTKRAAGPRRSDPGGIFPQHSINDLLPCGGGDRSYDGAENLSEASP
jgi:hypothetical protein